MRNLVAPAAACAAFAMLCSATPALAASAVTYVSGAGADSGSCTPQNPCRTFAFALGQTSAGGEIKALDPADYGPVAITQSVSITGVEGAKINSVNIGNPYISIAAGSNDVVNIANLILDGRGSVASGINLNTGGALTIKNCIVRRFANSGIVLNGSTNFRFLVEDVTASDNGSAGVLLNASSGVTLGALNRYTAHNNGAGVTLTPGQAYLSAVDSVVADNSGNGFGLGPGNTLRLEHTKVVQNGTGVYILQSRVESAGNNFIDGNAGKDIIGGSLTYIGIK